MLVRFEDIKKNQIWINPIHVKMLRQKKDITEIFITFQRALGSPALKVRMPLEEVAATLNAAMPDLPFVPDDDPGFDQSGGAGTAAMMG